MRQLIRFSIVGVLNTLVHLGLFYLLLTFAHWHYLAASGAGFVAAVVNSFVFNKYWTFGARGGDPRRQFLRFVIVSVVALLFNLAVLALLVDTFLWNPLLAQVAGVGVTLIVNFTAVRYAVFSSDAIARG